jgi:ABC-type antimicrobial peptide transport system permease subunit
VVIEQVRQIMDQIAQTMSAVFLFTLLSGLAVLYAALLATQDERIHQAAILRTLGADSCYLRLLHLTEFAVLGALSGLFAAAGAILLGWMLAIKVLEFLTCTAVRVRLEHRLVTRNFSSPWVRLCVRFGAGEIFSEWRKILTFLRVGQTQSGFFVRVQREKLTLTGVRRS